MKRSLITLLVLAMTASAVFFTGCGSDAKPTTSAEAVSKSADAAELLNTIMNAVDENEAFPAAGGDEDNTNFEGAGKYDIEKNAEAFRSLILVPEDKMSSLKNDAATLMHMMNANSFCAAAFKLNPGTDAKAFAESYKAAVQGNQWMCGMPDKVLVYSVDGYIMTVYGMEDCLGGFRTAVTKTFSDAELLIDAPAVA